MNIFDVRIYVFIFVDSVRQSKVIIIIINDNECTMDENARTKRVKIINFCALSTGVVFSGELNEELRIFTNLFN